ncbi:hypothetical protein JW935_03970 [candidate division KSB1 bacterium]|nr:hypothetical protein [candidate division KSB1 bacterium]
MKFIRIFAFLAVFISFSFVFSTPKTDSDDMVRSSVPVKFPFLLNKGQLDSSVLYYTKMPRGMVYLSDGGEIIYHHKNSGNNYTAFQEFFIDSRIGNITARDTSATIFNHFKGRDRSRWQSGIPGYGLLELHGVYPGIDVCLKVSTIEKVFTVSPGADPSQIRVLVTGAHQLHINDHGELLAIAPEDTMVFTRPVAWQNGRQVEVKYRVEGNIYSFALGDYDKAKKLIIDPLIASTFLGGSAWDTCLDMAVDRNNRIFVCGRTSVDFPVTGDVF